MTDSNGTPLPTDDITARAYETAKRRQAAATAVLKMLEESFPTTLKNHVPTALCAAAWLAGTSLYRSMGYKQELEPGVLVLSPEVDQKMPAMTKMFMYLLDKDGVKLAPDGFVTKRPEEFQPRATLLEVQQAMQARFNDIMKANQFDYMEGAKTGAVVCELLVKVYALRRKDLEVNMAASIVMAGFIEGAKTAPARLEQGA